MNWFKSKEIVTPVKDTIVEHSNGVKINYSLYGRVLSAKRNLNQITNYPNQLLK